MYDKTYENRTLIRLSVTHNGNYIEEYLCVDKNRNIYIEKITSIQGVNTTDRIDLTTV